MKEKFFIILFLLTTLVVLSQNSNDEEHIGAWGIKNGVFIETTSKQTKLAKKNWQVFYNIFPKKITQKYVKKIVLFTDGVDEKTGALGSLNEENDEWQLMLDIADVNFDTSNRERLNQSIYTLLHEFGHLITLNSSQIKPTKKEKQEKGAPYITYEGEALKKSYINLFVSKFWDGKLLRKWDFIKKEYCFMEQESCLEHLYGLYRENYTDFVTDYAAESPEEDIVESWTAFVLRDKIETPQTVAEQKINFFYNFPELIKYRKIIRKNLRKYNN